VVVASVSTSTAAAKVLQPRPRAHVIAALGVRASHFGQVSRAPFGREAGRIKLVCDAQGPACVAELDRNSDLMERHVGRAELRAVLVPIGIERLSELCGGVDMAVRLLGLF
jgi:hypothetical protein